MAQNEVPFNAQIDSIITYEDAKTFIKSNKALNGKLLTFNKEKHKTTLASELFDISRGGKKTYTNEIGSTTYKVLDKNDVPHYRASIILFDTKKRSAAEINELYPILINAYNSGNRSFEDLAKVYSKGRSSKTGGDLGWLKSGQKSEAFEAAINKQTKGDIFYFEDPSNSKKYIILKTEDWTSIEEITILKINEPRN